MRIIDTAHVLAKIQAFTNRNVDEAVITTWHEILEPYELEDCLRAVTDYFRRSKEWLMPIDILELVKGYQADRLKAFPADLRIAEADDRACLDNAGWAKKNRHLHYLAKNGHITPAQYEDYHAGKIHLADLGPKELTR